MGMPIPSLMVMPTRPVPPFNGKWGTTYKPQQPAIWPKLGNWNKWFAWHPITVNGSRHWLTFVYRRKRVSRVDMNLYGQWEYGTIFDVLGS